MNYTEVEQTIRFRKKVEKEESYVNALSALGGVSSFFAAVSVCFFHFKVFQNLLTVSGLYLGRHELG